MRISELIEQLEDTLEEHGDLDIDIAFQPHYPLQSPLKGVAVWQGPRTEVYLCAGNSTNYAEAELWDAFE